MDSLQSPSTELELRGCWGESSSLIKVAILSNTEEDINLLLQHLQISPSLIEALNGQATLHWCQLKELVARSLAYESRSRLKEEGENQKKYGRVSHHE